MAKFAIFTFALLTTVFQIYAQENIEKNLAKGLQECYSTTDLLDIYKKRPMSMNYLIDLIRKVENSTNDNIRITATSLLHRFRQDGIRSASNVKSSKIIPYGPSGHEFDKFRIILHKLVPGNTVLFPNETLTREESCAVHYMLSESVDTNERGDEAETCKKKEKYRLRVVRSAPDDDVEILDNNPSRDHKGNIQQRTNPDAEVDITMKATLPTGPISECPLERGVVYNKWGTLSAGYILAGIAAGTEFMEIPVGGRKLNNIFGSTLAGDVAEAGYLAIANGETLKIGADGAWNFALTPHGYYLTNQNSYYLTDAEIRGSIDGLILGLKMKDYKNSGANLRLSQLLDMYYSERGLFSENIKACDRKALSTQYAPSDTLKEEAYSFALILHRAATVLFTLNEDAIQSAINEAVEAFDIYKTSSLRDLQCSIDNKTPFQTVKADYLIVLDCSWQYDTIYAALTQLLDIGDTNPFNSRYTIINAQTGDYIINASNSVADFHAIFNKTYYEQLPKGFDINVSLKKLEEVTRTKIDEEKNRSDPTGKSLVGLIISNSGTMDNANREFIRQRIDEVFNAKLPDLKIVAMTSGAAENFQDIVKDIKTDVFILRDIPDSSQISDTLNRLVGRIKQIPNRIVSFKCGGDWFNSGNEKKLDQYVEPKGIIFYRLLPNYFFESGVGPRTIKIKGYGTETLNVCYSRAFDLALMIHDLNSTSSNNKDVITCKSITSGEVSIELVDPCYEYSRIKDCPSLYISVQSQGKQSGSFASCSDPKVCRFPDNQKFTISTDNLGCYSSASILLTNLFMLISLLGIVYIRNNNI